MIAGAGRAGDAPEVTSHGPPGGGGAVLLVRGGEGATGAGARRGGKKLKQNWSQEPTKNVGYQIVFRIYSVEKSDTRSKSDPSRIQFSILLQNRVGGGRWFCVGAKRGMCAGVPHS